MRTARLLFSKGKRVEVSLERVENSEVWFPAIVEEETGNGSFLVEYQCLGKNGVPESVKIKVDCLHIRPSPPQFVKNYDLLEKVDAYIDFGWWTGVITKELPDSKYFIFFKQTKKQRLVNQSEIRPHMEWKEGNWFSASQDACTSPDHQRPAKYASYNVQQTEIVSPCGLGTLKGTFEKREADSINSLDIRIERSTPSGTEPSTVMTSQRKKAKMLNPDTDEQTKTMKHVNLSDLLHLSTDHMNSSPVDAPGEEIHFGCATSTNRDIRTNDSMVGLLLSRAKRARSKRHKSAELENTPDPRRRNAGRPPKSPTGATQALAGDKRGGELDNRTPEPIGKNNEMLPITQMNGGKTSGDKNNDVRCTKEILVESVCVVEANQFKELPHIPREALLSLSGDLERRPHDLAVDGIKDANQLEGHREIIGKRKRGRPPKKLTKSPEVGRQNVGKNLAKSPEVNQRNGGVDAAAMALEEVLLPVVVGLEAAKVDGSGSNKEKLGVDRKILNGSVDRKSKSSSDIEVYPANKEKLQSRKFVQALVEEHEKDLSKTGRGRIISINTESPNQDPEGASVRKMAEDNGKDSLVNEAETSLPFNISEDQPLSKWLVAPQTVDATSTSQGTNVELCTTNRSPKDIVVQPPQCNHESLPFEKRSPLWKTIEAMEVFRQLPQKPHFQSLGSKKESSREGLAIALMVDFAGVVEKTSTLQFDGPRSIIFDNMETLLELENNGFDIKVVWERLSRLQSIKDKHEDLQGKSKETTDQIKEKKHKKINLNEKIEEIDNQIRLLQEERTLVLSAKEVGDSAIASLELTVNGINSSIENVHLEFEALVAAPWQVP